MTPMEVLKEIARGRTDNGRPLAAETARQKARRWLTLCGIDWGAKNAPSAPGKTGMDKTLAEIAGLLSKLTEAKGIIGDCQSVLAKYLPPDSGIAPQQCISDLLAILDGPRARTFIKENGDV